MNPFIHIIYNNILPIFMQYLSSFYSFFINFPQISCRQKQKIKNENSDKSRISAVLVS